jgi:tRNA threonylcarbamoyladenosine biosynthesis protein TsaB
VNPDEVHMVAIETATETVGVAVRTMAGVQAELTLTGRRRHVETLTPALQHLLNQVGLEARDVGVVAVDLGPGLFTGLRVGVSAAKGLAQALGIGVIGVTSLEILTAGAAAAGLRGRILSAVDARRGEVFASLGLVDPSGALVESGPVHLVAPDELAANLSALGGEPVLAVGDGAQRYAERLEAVPGVRCVRPALAWPPPAALLALAADRLAEGETPVTPGRIVPLYMREADARSNFTQVTRS